MHDAYAWCVMCDVYDLGSEILGNSRKPQIPLPIPTLSSITMQTCSSDSPTHPEDSVPVSLPGKKSQSSRCHWLIPNEAALISFLTENHSEITDNAMFKDRMFREAATDVNRLLKKGATKTGDSCKAKWCVICISFVYILSVFWLVWLVKEEAQNYYYAQGKVRIHMGQQKWNGCNIGQKRRVAGTDQHMCICLVCQWYLISIRAIKISCHSRKKAGHIMMPWIYWYHQRPKANMPIGACSKHPLLGRCQHC